LRITPLNIKNQEFNKSVRGYDKDEVHVFLEKLADEFEEISKENELMKKELSDAKTQLVEFRRIEKNLQETLLKAQESSTKSIESAKKQTTLMIKEAELKAEQIVEKARKEADFLREALIKLREEKNLIHAKLKALVATQTAILESGKDKNLIAQDGKEINSNNDFNIDINQIVEKLL